MQIKIFSSKELDEDNNLKNKAFETWLYAYKSNMTQEDYWTESEDETLEDIKKYYEKNKVYFFETELKNAAFFVLCIDNDKILGQLELQIDDNDIIICALGVHHQYRNIGIASMLLKSSINFVSNTFPSYNLISYVKTNNNASLNLHKKLGFIKSDSVNAFDSYEFKHEMKNIKK